MGDLDTLTSPKAEQLLGDVPSDENHKDFNTDEKGIKK